ncbi:hypothetical protein [Campylobacter jejuni]|uniref:YopX protein domain-containing protein n=1 Tax=Campylobacter jejuni TaxID=197 RepID=A0A431EA89_CAMJU|nr:hypothetical protein [Campylobacter jejuni]RTJ78322.1 hypothetical protein C3H57_08425 [Campylobacter jejuni]
MKLDNFDFRIWNEKKGTYEDSDSIVKVFQDKLCNKDVSNYNIELFTGVFDKHNNKIHVGDIIKVTEFNGKELFYEVRYDDLFNSNVLFRIRDLNTMEVFDTLNSDRFTLNMFKYSYYYEELKAKGETWNVEVYGNIHYTPSATL